MPLDRDARNRRSIRLPGHDYASPGAYYVTIITKDREPILGTVENGRVDLNALGEIVKREWLRSQEIRTEVVLDTFIVMPNHLHAIVHFRGVGAHGRAPLQAPSLDQPLARKSRSLGSMIAGFKASATNAINTLRNTPGVPVWQRNYYERIIRDDAELARIRRYIADNPANWQSDPENPLFVQPK